MPSRTLTDSEAEPPISRRRRRRSSWRATSSSGSTAVSVATRYPRWRDVTHKVGPSLRNIAGKLDAGLSRRPDPQSGRLPADHADAAAVRSRRASCRPGAGRNAASRRKPRFAPWSNTCWRRPRRSSRRLRRRRDSAAFGERGRRLFEMQGCLACHRHRDFPRARRSKGPTCRTSARIPAGTRPRG